MSAPPSPWRFAPVPLPLKAGEGRRPPSPAFSGRGTAPKAQGEGGVKLAALTALLLTAACNLAPIYAQGTHGPAATTLSQIQVAPIPDRAGYLLRQQLLERLNPGETPRYRLEITLDDKLTGFGIRTDQTITRERRALRARYRLVATDTNTVLIDATAAADEGIDVVQSEYAVVAAEQTALERLAIRLADQITARVALYARQAARTPALPQPEGGEASQRGAAQPQGEGTPPGRP